MFYSQYVTLLQNDGHTQYTIASTNFLHVE